MGEILIYNLTQNKNRPETDYIKSIMSPSSAYVTKWSLRPSLLSQCHQIAASKNLALFILKETMSFPCGRLLIYWFVSQNWHLINCSDYYCQIIRTTNKSTFDTMCCSKPDAAQLLNTSGMSVGLEWWLTGIQWKSNMCQNKSSAMPDSKNTSQLFMWMGRAGGPEPTGVRHEASVP